MGWKSLIFFLRWSWYLMICTGVKFRRVLLHVRWTSAEKSVINAFLGGFSFALLPTQISWGLLSYDICYTISVRTHRGERILNIFMSRYTQLSFFSFKRPDLRRAGIPDTQNCTKELSLQCFQMQDAYQLKWSSDRQIVTLKFCKNSRPIYFVRGFLGRGSQCLVCWSWLARGYKPAHKHCTIFLPTTSSRSAIISRRAIVRDNLYRTVPSLGL